MANISDLRKAAGLTQQQLADKMGVNRSTVAMWETGVNAPKTKMLLALAEVLGCSVEDLLKPA